MFFARWDLGGPWNSSGIEGSARWLRRVWALFMDSHAEITAGNTKPDEADVTMLQDLRRKLHQTLRKVTHDFENFEFNTIISSLMELLNVLYKARDRGALGTSEWSEVEDVYLRMMAPVTPHIAEELWSQLSKPYSIHTQRWPEYDEEAAAEDIITLVVQVNGKLRDRIEVPADISDVEAKAIAISREAVKRLLSGKEPRKVIYVPGRLVNVVV
jgi:leucyl-tRNA synthetase